MKFIVIDEDPKYFGIITEHLKVLGLDFYPKYPNQFESFVINVNRAFNESKLIAGESLDSLLRKIDEFKNNSESVVYIVDYEFGGGNIEINGVEICKKILPVGFNNRVIIISDTSDIDCFEKINNFVVNQSNCYFVPKNQKEFLIVLVEKIYSTKIS